MPDTRVGTAIAVIDGIGRDWNAAAVERSQLDFKETPDTAWTPEQRRRQNLGRARKRFLGELAEDAACLANAQGGAIVLGVRDAAADRAAALQGVGAEYTPQAVRLAIYNGTVPPLTVSVFEHEVDRRRLLIIDVPTGAVVHSTAGGTYKWRVEDRCVPIPPETLRSLSAGRGMYDWSAEPTDLGPESLSATALAAAADRLRAAGANELADQAESDRVQFLRSCELLAGERVRRAAVVLYGSGPALARLLPDWGVVVTTAPSAGGEGTVVLRREEAQRRPLSLLIDDVIGRVAGLARGETIRVGATEVRLIDYPDDVVRELVANAFAHRDWEQSGIIEVAHSPDALVVSSPGDLLPTLHEDRLLRESAQRNRVLSREITRLRMAEGAGMGFDRVFRSLAAVGKDPPSFKRGPRFAVVVPGGHGERAFARYLNSPEFPDPRLATDLDVLLALLVLRRRASLTAKAAAPVLQRDAESSAAVLRRMHAAGLLEPTRSTATRRWPSYRLSPATSAALRGALTYRTGSIDADDLKLLRHLKRHRRIANEDVRNYLDCDVPTARNRLTRLRERGYIDFAPDGPRRGPLVEYVATVKVDDEPG